MTRSAIQYLPRNALHNLGATLIPLVVALFATPFVVHSLGDERFGLYMLALSAVGFGGLLDLGLVTATIKFVAESRARGDERQLSRVVNSLLLSRLPLGLAVVILGYLLAPALCEQLLRISAPLLPDAIFIVRIGMVTLAVGMVGGTLAALPRAVHRYDLASRIGIGTSLALTATTVALLALGYGLRQIALAELAIALAHLSVSALIARRVLPGWRFELRVEFSWLGPLFRFAGWTSIGTLTGIILLHVNRILVGRYLGTSAVTYFAIPWNLSTRVPQFVNTLAEAITPVATGLAVEDAAATLQGLYRRGLRLVAMAAASVAVPLYVGSGDFLGLWLGAEFVRQSAPALRILAVAAGIQSLGAVPYFVLNGIGRPAEANLPTVVGTAVNLALLVVLVPARGIEGVSLAIAAGLSAQTALLILALDRAVRMPRSAAWGLARPASASVLAAIVGSFTATLLPESWAGLVLESIVTLTVLHIALALSGSYDQDELRYILNGVRRREDSR